MAKFDFKKAFALPKNPELTEDDKTMVRAVANKIRHYRLEGIALLGVEGTKPLHNIGNHAMMFLKPLLELALGTKNTDAISKLLDNPLAVDMLLALLDSEEKVSHPNSKTGDNNGK